MPSVLVVPLDGSDFAQRAVAVACRYALAFDAEVVAVTTPQTIEEGSQVESPAWLTALTADTPDARIRTVVAAADDPAHAVAELVAQTEGAAVCMATHARGAIGSAALGNVAQRVLREVPTPVLLVGRHCVIDDADHGPMVVAHDGSEAADAVLAPALAWASACGFPLVLVHVYHPLDVVSPERLDDAVVSAHTRLGVGARLEVVASSFPAGAIRDLAHELDASAIAISTHGHTGTASVSMGRVASWVTRESPCPVLTVRPAKLSDETAAPAGG